MLSRYATAITSGTVATFALLYLMQLLISLQPAAASESGSGIPIILTRTIIDSEPEVIKPKPFNREQFKVVDPTPSRPTVDNDTPTAGVRGSAPPVNGTFGLPDFGTMTDGPLVAMVRVSPIYPARLAAQGVEGYVVVEFDVLADGLVANVIVIESSNSGFDKSAVDAAHKFRFKPRIVNGMALATNGIRNKFTYQMDD